MKEKDFDEIGKRLHNMEAEPPKEGWKRVGAAIQTLPSGKVVWLKKFWWLPLLFIVPAAVYVWYPAEHAAAEINSEANALPTNQIKDTAENSSKPHAIITSSEKQTSDSPQPLTTKQQPAIAKTDIRKATDKIGSENNEGQLDKPTGVIAKRQATDNLQNDVNATRLTTDIQPTAAEGAQPSSSLVETNIKHDETIASSSLPPDSAQLNAKQIESAIASTETTALAVAPKEVAAIDSTVSPLAAEEQIKNTVDSVSAEEDEIIKKKIASSQWRWSIAFAPQYITRAVKPLKNDEVLITNVRFPAETQNIGYHIAAGLGKSIKENWWLDARVSYTALQQDIFFSANTGKVDTLLAVLQADQSVRVTPVFEIADREVKSKLHYVGISLNSTFYFWTNTRRRFNLQAGVSGHYLLQNKVQEKVDQRWVNLSANDSDKINFSATVGGGYNLWISEGWELMINPTLTYFLREVRNSELPYNISQRAVGMNFTLSKIIK